MKDTPTTEYCSAWIPTNGYPHIVTDAQGRRILQGTVYWQCGPVAKYVYFCETLAHFVAPGSPHGFWVEDEDSYNCREYAPTLFPLHLTVNHYCLPNGDLWHYTTAVSFQVFHPDNTAAPEGWTFFADQKKVADLDSSLLWYLSPTEYIAC